MLLEQLMLEPLPTVPATQTMAITTTARAKARERERERARTMATTVTTASHSFSRRPRQPSRLAGSRVELVVLAVLAELVASRVFLAAFSAVVLELVLVSRRLVESQALT
jgi:hypothetical protein